MTKAYGYAAKHSFSRLKLTEIDRAEPRPNEVRIDVLYCGVCLSDIHQVENDWSNTVYPCMPGHEIVGRVAAAGSAVTLHSVGDLVGVGCMIDSCRHCEPCQEGDQHLCEGPNSWLATYNGPMKPASQAKTGTNAYGIDNTFGGYSEFVVVPEDFVLKIPASIPPEKAAPILCAGVTTFSPLQHWGVEPGSKVGVVGLGGLGHMAVKLAVAMGAEVTVFTTDDDKVAAAKALGAAEVIVEGDDDAYESHELGFDLILSTIPEKHKVDPFIKLLKRDGTYCAVGALAQIPGYNNQELVMHRRTLAGSLIGSIKETQQVLDFCAEHDIAPDVQVIAIQDINDAYKKVKDEDVRFRYVIDMASLKGEIAEGSSSAAKVKNADPRGNAPVPYDPAVEHAESDEPETIAELDRTMGKIRETTFEHSGHARRSVHVKSHGILRATLTVEPDLPEPLAQGLFAAPGSYEALMRFSSPPGDMLDDKVSLSRALAVKIVGVPGERLAGSEGDRTQNFIFIDSPIFSAPSAKGFLRNLKLLEKTTDKAEAGKKALSATLRAAERVVEMFGAKSATLTSLGGHPFTHPLSETYFTAAPHLHGRYMAKLSLAPQSRELLDLIGRELDLDDRPDGLRDEVVAFMRSQRAEWALQVQLCTDTEEMPIEDPSVEWDTGQSPYVTVARLVAEPQLTWSDELATYVNDHLFFSPWRGLAAHRPLGDVMRARKPAYEHSAQFRAAKNGVPVEEPEDLSAVPR